MVLTFPLRYWKLLRFSPQEPRGQRQGSKASKTNCNTLNTQCGPGISSYQLHFGKEIQISIALVGLRAELGIFVLGGPNFGINILVLSQDKPLYICINVHTQI